MICDMNHIKDTFCKNQSNELVIDTIFATIMLF